MQTTATTARCVLDRQIAGDVDLSPARVGGNSCVREACVRDGIDEGGLPAT